MSRQRLKTTSFLGNGRPVPESLLLLTSGSGYDRNEGTGNDINCMCYFIKNNRRQRHRRTKLSNTKLNPRPRLHQSRYIQDISVLLWGNISVLFLDFFFFFFSLTSMIHENLPHKGLKMINN